MKVVIGSIIGVLAASEVLVLPIDTVALMQLNYLPLVDSNVLFRKIQA